MDYVVWFCYGSVAQLSVDLNSFLKNKSVFVSFLQMHASYWRDFSTIDVLMNLCSCFGLKSFELVNYIVGP